MIGIFQDGPKIGQNGLKISVFKMASDAPRWP